MTTALLPADAALETASPHVVVDTSVDQRLDARAAVLAARCATRLRASARSGGPSVDEHLEELRRLLVRRDGRRGGLTRRRQRQHVLDAVRSGRVGAVRPGDRSALVRDLDALLHALDPRGGR
jgi:hypothetical protein